MTQEILIGIVAVIGLGIAAQWIAWRFRLPSILLLLVFGFVAGPVTGFLPAESLQGNWLYAFVSVSIGIILFEGGLSLRLSELREVGAAVLNLVTIGVLVTWALAGLAAYFIVGLNLSLSVLVGAILTVTGPTVVIPLLRHVRPTGRVGAVAKWEGITIDPVGAILAVLVLETILLLNQPLSAGGDTVGDILLHAAEGLLLTLVISVGIAVIGSAFLIFVLHRRLVPDYLQSATALAVVVGTFGMSNSLQEESGLLEVTLMGIIMANQKWVPVRRISEFKRDLQVLLIGSLFILLSARLDISALDYMLDGRTILFLVVLILLVRPVAVAVSSLGSRLEFREKAFLAWLAPRGIVAAAVASLFSFRLREIFPGQADDLVPLVFMVIVGTVAVYGLTVVPVARWLGLAHPNPQGVLFLGASLWVQRMAMAVKQLGFKVVLIDANANNVQQAKQRELEALTADALSETIVDVLDLGGIGRFMAVTPNDEVNSLACLNFAEIFDSSDVFQLAARTEIGADRSSDLPQHLRGHPLFGEKSTYATMTERFSSGGEIRTFILEEGLTFDNLKARYDDDLILLFAGRGQNDLLVNAQEGSLTPQLGDRVIVSLPSHAYAKDQEYGGDFDRLVANALVIDLKEPIGFEDLARDASALFAQRLPVTADTLVSGFIEGARYGAMPIAEGVALPHYRLPAIQRSELLLVRCRDGLQIHTDRDGDEAPGLDFKDPVYAMIFLVSPQEHPGHHLRILANLANRIDDSDFVGSYRNARSEHELKLTLMDPDRLVDVSVDDERVRLRFEGRAVGELDTPGDTHVAWLLRDGHVDVPSADTVLRSGDRVTIAGDPVSIRHLAEELGVE